MSATAGFARSIARGVRRVVEQERQSPAFDIPSATVKTRWQMLDEYAEHVEHLGDEDGGVVAIATATELLTTGTTATGFSGALSFTPTKTAAALLGNVRAHRAADLEIGQSKAIQSPDDIHAQLVRAVVRDAAEAIETRLKQQASPELDAARREAQFALEQLDRERLEVRRLSSELADRDRILASSEHQRLDLERRVRGLAFEPDQPADDTVEADLSSPRVLPGFPGVTVRATTDGELRFGARWPRKGAARKTDTRSGFSTPQEAQAFRESMLKHHDAKRAQQAADNAAQAHLEVEREEIEAKQAKIAEILRRNPGLSPAGATRLAEEEIAA